MDAEYLDRMPTEGDAAGAAGEGTRPMQLQVGRNIIDFLLQLLSGKKDQEYSELPRIFSKKGSHGHM